VVEDAVMRIGENPLAYPERYQENRRAILRRFPCVIWFRLEGESAVILACVHGKRDPRLARTRLRGG
jgi:plasmid stabilization system protein ParE